MRTNTLNFRTLDKIFDYAFEHAESLELIDHLKRMHYGVFCRLFEAVLARRKNKKLTSPKGMN